MWVRGGREGEEIGIECWNAPMVSCVPISYNDLIRVSPPVSRLCEDPRLWTDGMNIPLGKIAV